MSTGGEKRDGQTGRDRSAEGSRVEEGQGPELQLKGRRLLVSHNYISGLFLGGLLRRLTGASGNETRREEKSVTRGDG